MIGGAPIDVLTPLIANYRIYGFLETQTLMALEGGMYKFV
jgi:hypothetical protein